ncbi:MAG: L-threonylcarbamoyladenylate synthase [Chloroflexi bacterium]|nr:L-threonylcarbamoyladenylate synthase [Chloroflexota bacterium]MCL5076116.1 L-threonylcarbamoyladenylate synthase [Chloroflexota bacterium]
MSRNITTKVLKVDDPIALREAVEILQAGGLVAFPTDTVYGLGAHGYQDKAIEQIYRVKGREKSKPIPLLLAKAEEITLVAQDVPQSAWRLAGRFWPGGLTLILLKRPNVPTAVSPGPTVAVRVPDHQVALRLITALQAPLAATSANRSGMASPTTAAQTYSQLVRRIPLILDGGTCPQGTPSTILDLTREPPIVLRQGTIPIAALEEAVGRKIRLL